MLSSDGTAAMSMRAQQARSLAIGLIAPATWEAAQCHFVTMALKNRHVVSHNAMSDSRNGIHTTESPPTKPAQGGRGLWQGGLNPPDPSSFEPLSEPPRALPHTTGARTRHRTGTIRLRSNAPSSVHASTKPGSNCPILPFDGTGAMSVCTQQARFLAGTGASKWFVVRRQVHHFDIQNEVFLVDTHQNRWHRRVLREISPLGPCSWVGVCLNGPPK